MSIYLNEEYNKKDCHHLLTDDNHMHMNTQQAAKWFGIILLAVGILGFIPGVVTTNYLLLGIFQVDAMHNVIHIVSGVIGIASAASFKGSKLYFKIFGIVYGIVTILGFIGGGMVLGMMMNMADNILHLAITAFSLYYGFRSEREG
jgi:hypothetical protein